MMPVERTFILQLRVNRRFEGSLIIKDFQRLFAESLKIEFKRTVHEFFKTSQ